MNSAFRVESPGVLATLQDLGRPQYRASGVPIGGAMDRFALMAANRLVDNSPGAGCLEVVVGGTKLLTLRDCSVAVTGGDLSTKVNGRDAPLWTSFAISTGDRLTFGSRRSGARAYLAVAGGFVGDVWLGSVSTSLLVTKGGIEGRPIHRGDELAVANVHAAVRHVGQELRSEFRPAYVVPGAVEIAVVRGPQFSRLARVSQHAFFGRDYQVSLHSDRMGFRLEGEALVVQGPELLSFGLAPGCVQVPRNGQPILLMADAQTAGGYPVIAGVVRADLPVAAQLLPGDRLRFRPCNVEDAQQRWRQLMAGLESIGQTAPIRSTMKRSNVRASRII